MNALSLEIPLTLYRYSFVCCGRLGRGIIDQVRRYEVLLKASVWVMRYGAASKVRIVEGSSVCLWPTKPAADCT